MDLQFYRCDTCTKLEEHRVLMTRGSCKCGGRRVKPVLLSGLELCCFILWHPSYLVKALRGE